MEKHQQPAAHLLTFKKSFFYNILPSKQEEEDHCRGTNKKPFQVKKLVEVRDIYQPPSKDPVNPWQIRKVLSAPEVTAGKIILPYSEVFDHIFRYWTMDMTSYVVLGSKLQVTIWDLTDDNPLRVCGENIILQLGPNDNYYLLGITDLIQNRSINPGDEVGLYWEPRTSAFHFKILHRKG